MCTFQLLQHILLQWLQVQKHKSRMFLSKYNDFSVNEFCNIGASICHWKNVSKFLWWGSASLKMIFPDSKITQEFSEGKTKAPYFQEITMFCLRITFWWALEQGCWKRANGLVCKIFGMLTYKECLHNIGRVSTFLGRASADHLRDAFILLN